MNTAAILDTAAFQRGYLTLLTSDIPDDQLTTQPKGYRNHPAWQIGHIAWAADGLVGALGGKPALDKAWVTRFSAGSQPTADRSAYPAKNELLATLDDHRNTAASLLRAATPQQLAAPNPVPLLAPHLPTLAHFALFILLFHESTHLGQLSTWRKLSNMPEALSKFPR